VKVELEEKKKGRGREEVGGGEKEERPPPRPSIRVVLTGCTRTECQLREGVEGKRGKEMYLTDFFSRSSYIQGANAERERQEGKKGKSGKVSAFYTNYHLLTLSIFPASKGERGREEGEGG